MYSRELDLDQGAFITVIASRTTPKNSSRPRVKSPYSTYKQIIVYILYRIYVAEPELHHLVGAGSGAGAVTRCGSGSGSDGSGSDGTGSDGSGSDGTGSDGSGSDGSGSDNGIKHSKELTNNTKWNSL
jgi:hypothetical protein